MTAGFLVHDWSAGLTGDTEGGSSAINLRREAVSAFPATSTLQNRRSKIPWAAGKNGPAYAMDGPAFTLYIVAPTPEPASVALRTIRFEEPI